MAAPTTEKFQIRADRELINRAKAVAASRGTKLSALIKKFLLRLVRNGE